MKFRRNAATIAIYFLFTLLWMNLFINASDDEQQTVNIMKRKREHEIDENTNINLDLATDFITNTLQQTSLHTSQQKYSFQNFQIFKHSRHPYCSTDVSQISNLITSK